jgi:hypothetical protein
MEKEELIEQEEGNEDIAIESPFNPNDINISIVPRTIGQIVDMLRYGEILIPSYQRLPDLWNNRKKSRFIESLMLNLPIPLFYFDEGEDRKWKVIDGLQRVSTLEHFINLCDDDSKGVITKNRRSLVLENLEFKPEFNGKTWEELPRDIQRRIETNQITINLIGKGTPEEVKYNIFSRINQGSEILRAQEIRTAIFQGYRIQFLESLVVEDTTSGQAFKKATNNSVSKKRQDDLDFASRFISFYLLGYEKYEPDMDSFITLGMKSIPNDSSEQEKIRKDFKKAMNGAFEVFGTDSFRKTENSSQKRINKSLFEIISLHFAKLTQNKIDAIILKRVDFVAKFNTLQQDKNFFDVITTGTASKESVKRRHEIFKNFLNEFIQ